MSDLNSEKWAGEADKQEALTNQIKKLEIARNGDSTDPKDYKKCPSNPEKDDEKVLKAEQNSLMQKLIRDKLVQTTQTLDIQQRDPTSPLYSVKRFEDLYLSEELLNGIYEMGFSKPSKIQETALPLLLKNPPENMIAQSQSGTGKTAAFVLTMLSRVVVDRNYPQCLCLSPTYELALQTGKVLQEMGKNIKDLEVAYSVRNNKLKPQDKLSAHVIIGTPGTTEHWIRRKAFDPAKISVFVLDEADIMIDTQNFQDDSIRIQRKLSKHCQMLLFSATYEDTVMEFARKIVPQPNVIRLQRGEETLCNIKQYFSVCAGREKKFEALTNIYGVLTIGQAIIFCATRRTAKWLAEQMCEEGFVVALLSGELDVMQRAMILRRFKEGLERVLITTNVCSRGIDVEQVTLVVNFDMPLDTRGRADCETYLHRIGRTGRFGKSGIAINFVHQKKDMNVLADIERHFGIKIQSLDTDDFGDMESKIGDK